ncbi:MAG: hypothetical protein AABY79_09270 [Nitrospirota bacterium]|jgi:hypothetical protein
MLKNKDINLSGKEELHRECASAKEPLLRHPFYTHTCINDNTKKTLEAASFLYSLIKLLNEKGLISIEEMDERKRQVAER